MSKHSPRWQVVTWILIAVAAALFTACALIGAGLIAGMASLGGCLLVMAVVLAMSKTL